MNAISVVSTRQSPSYKWYILTLAALTFTCVMAIPNMSLSVLFSEIQRDLGLNLVQVGWIWGIGSVMGIVVALIGGPLSDQLGARVTLIGAIAILSIFGALRGFAWNFSTLAASMLMMGFASSTIPMNIHKVCGIWFAGPRLGMANGVVSVGMAFGFMIGSLLAATVLSPLLGGWRNVLFLYGGVALLFSLFWAVSQEKEPEVGVAQTVQPPQSLWAALHHVASLPNVWLFSLATLGVASCITGTLGYLPLYLRHLGWREASADGALASFHAVSMVAAIPITLLSDRLRARREVLMVAALFVTVGVGLLAVVQGPLIWLAVIVAGVVRDGYMATTMTALMEVKGVGGRYAASASGILIGVMSLGSLIAPPLGNSLERFSPTAPFALWAGMALLGFCVYWLIRERVATASINPLQKKD